MAKDLFSADHIDTCRLRNKTPSIVSHEGIIFIKHCIMPIGIFKCYFIGSGNGRDCCGSWKIKVALRNNNSYFGSCLHVMLCRDGWVHVAWDGGSYVRLSVRWGLWNRYHVRRWCWRRLNWWGFSRPPWVIAWQAVVSWGWIYVVWPGRGWRWRRRQWILGWCHPISCGGCGCDRQVCKRELLLIKRNMPG